MKVEGEFLWVVEPFPVLRRCTLVWFVGTEGRIPRDWDGENQRTK